MRLNNLNYMKFSVWSNLNITQLCFLNGLKMRRIPKNPERKLRQILLDSNQGGENSVFNQIFDNSYAFLFCNNMTLYQLV